LDGAWENEPGALIHTEDEGEVAPKEVSPPARAPATRGRGRGRGTNAASINMVLDDDDDEDDDEDLFVKTPAKGLPGRATATSSRNARSSQAAAKQSKLDFSRPSQSRARPVSSRAAAQKKQVIEVSDDDISDDDAFEPVPTSSRITRSRR
jgi:double-strand break repair protein MRE11